jgi:hypothetical protein
MNRADVIRELQMLPELVKRAELNYLNSLNTVNELKKILLEKESELINSGKINMKNEQTREAGLWPHTKELHQKLLRADLEKDKLKVEYYYQKHRLESMQLIAQMVSRIT